MFEEKVEVLSRMTAEHLAVPFPPGCRGLEIGDQDMVLLDADAYGYATSVLKGPLAEQPRAALTELVTVLDEILRVIDDEYARTYYTRVREMAALAAEVENLREQ